MPPETLGSRLGSVAAGRDQEVREATHNWPSVVRVREGLAGRDILVSSRTSDSCGGPGAVHASQVHGVSADTLVRLASGLDARCVKRTQGLSLSRARTGVVTTNNWIPQNWGVKYKNK